uniref:Myelin basic protein n=1 Tax=Myotis myotis TaxID=51298 RepID=A0A7J7VZ48_MYOMY|nr:myelin basic protein [Myotis myotis]
MRWRHRKDPPRGTDPSTWPPPAPWTTPSTPSSRSTETRASSTPWGASLEDAHHAARTTHYGSLPQKSQHGRPQDENRVVHFFKNLVTPRTPPPSQGKGRGKSLSRFSWGAEGQKPGFGYGSRAADYKSAHKGLKGQDTQSTLSKFFKLGGRDSRSGSPMARR